MSSQLCVVLFSLVGPVARIHLSIVPHLSYTVRYQSKWLDLIFIGIEVEPGSLNIHLWDLWPLLEIS